MQIAFPLREETSTKEENIRRTTSVALEAMGHEVVSVGQGATGLKQLERAHFDVAFLDLKLAGENGLELLPDLVEFTLTPYLGSAEAAELAREPA